MSLLNRFLKYISVDTTSEDKQMDIPSTESQRAFASLLVEEMKAIGIKDARTDTHAYVYGSIPPTPGCEEIPAIALIAHMDTSSACSGRNIHPQIIRNYTGEDVILGNSGYKLSNQNFPHLKSLKGRTLITTDGTTLLGADDKAGIAIIMTVVEQAILGTFRHGRICVAFTPDEEIGSGARLLQLNELNAQYGYTLDGSAEGEIQYENFNAGSACFEVFGISTHTGTAKNIMKNAQTIAMEIHQFLPENEVPEKTEGYQGFYHLMHVEGQVHYAKMKYLIRDFDQESYQNRKKYLYQIAEKIDEKYGKGTVKLTITDSYKNMKEVIENHMHLVENAKAACIKNHVMPIVEPIRGGTDGARLSFRGLPCPNLGTGGYAFHGLYEHITLEGMEKTVEIVKNILERETY